jgi:hypothetical protein
MAYFLVQLLAEQRVGVAELDMPPFDIPKEAAAAGTLSTISFRIKSRNRPYNICLTFSNAHQRQWRRSGPCRMTYGTDDTLSIDRMELQIGSMPG